MHGMEQVPGISFGNVIPAGHRLFADMRDEYCIQPPCFFCFIFSRHFTFPASRLTVFGSVQDWLIEGREVLETYAYD